MTEKRYSFNVNKMAIEKDGEYFAFTTVEHSKIVNELNALHEENHKIKSLLLKKVEELNDAYDKSARAGMPTGGIIGELDSFEEICEVMGWIE